MKKLIVFLLIGISSSVFPADIFVTTPKVIGADDSLKEAVRELIVAELEEKGHSIIGNPKKSNFSISSSIIKLENDYIIKMTKKETGKTTSKRMKSKTLDDIDITISRLVDTVLNNKSVKSTQQVEKITKHEQDEKRRKLKVDGQWVFGIGPSFLSNTIETQAYNLTFGYIWGIDTIFDLLVRWDISNAKGSSSAGFNMLTINGNYFFNKNIHAPFVEAGFGYARAENDASNKKVNGWILNIGGGMKFFRASTVNFGVEARYSLHLENVEGKAGKTEKPSQLAVSFLVFF
ncbi:MAG: hypothetical protein KAQ98_00110 [Bacteriovoracaceae bacterium]|nr:hypothetical protein [Bacteriovoracaceae bacterium]